MSGEDMSGEDMSGEDEPSSFCRGGVGVDKAGLIVVVRRFAGSLMGLMLALTVAACASGTSPGGNAIALPGPVTGLRVSATSVGADWLSLSWTNPAYGDYTGVMVRRSQGATPPTLTSGALVTDFSDQADYVVDPGLTPGTQYSYAFFAHDRHNHYAAAATVTGRTQAASTQTR
jgi:hypothetical protein